MQRYPQGELVVVLDCADLERAAAFWTAVLNYRREEYGGGPYLSLIPEDGRGVELLLQRTGLPAHPSASADTSSGPMGSAAGVQARR